MFNNYKQFIGIKTTKYNNLLKPFADLSYQLQYKYVFNIPGNAQAYRYPNEFKKKALILSVRSDQKMWFEPLLTNYKQIIYIDQDYMNLYSNHSMGQLLIR